jgi:Ca-activated chloride channel family protein
MNRLRLYGGMLCAGVVLALVVSQFPAQQPTPPNGQPPTKEQLQKLIEQQIQSQPIQAKPIVPIAPGGGPNLQVPPNQQVQPGNVQAGAPEPFTSKEGKKGWRVTIPGNRPLATPAVADGKLFLGGGFGSHEFYAFDAKTGKQLWLYRTGDDGPTAAAVEGDLIAFNTESCELEIITMEGKQLWKKWLGDPLMSMPAIHQGRVYMAYPDSKGGGGHKLVCFDIKTGKEQWKQKIAGDIITAPVIDNDSVYLTCLEGTVYCFTCKDGELVWSEKKNATSSPAVHNGKTYFSQREVKVVTNAQGKKVEQHSESLAAKPVAPTGGPGGVLSATTRPADYLDLSKRKDASPLEKQFKAGDAGVGFGAQPGAAMLSQAEFNLGQSTVNGVWAFQGSRPFVYKDQLFSSMGDVVKCVDPKTEKVIWKHSVSDEKNKGPLVDAALTPPAIVNGRLFVGTTAGQVICLNVESGQELWRATLGEPVLFQPAVAYGRVFVGTNTGKLYCIETGDTTDHGWMMWGANAQHNGQVTTSAR